MPQRIGFVADGCRVTAASTTEDWFSRSKRWSEDHQAYVEGWLEQHGGPAASLGHDIRASAAHSLLRIPEARAEGRAPGDPDREPYVWDEIDAYEILFCHVVHGGCGPDDAAEFLRLIGSFAAYLGEQGVIGRAEHLALQDEWPLWSQRLLEVWEEGGWYLADGTSFSREGLERRKQEAAARVCETGSRFGKIRRRTRPARRR